jgi:hypothetical protein
LPQATKLEEVDAEFRLILTPERIRAIVDLVPDEWLTGEASFENPAAYRDAYTRFLVTRIENSEVFIKEAQHAAETLI